MSELPEDADAEPNIWPQCAASPDCGYGGKARLGGLCEIHATAECAPVRSVPREQIDLFGANP